MSDVGSKDVQLISVDPPNTLLFKLERGAQTRSILRVTNTSQHKVVFKVKTTQPTWYYVRPNQQLLDIGQSEDVNILLVDTECNKFLDQVAANQNNVDKLEKHRFLVQSRVIEEDEFQRIRVLPASEKTDELSKLWDGPKDDKRNIKLKVEFKYPEAIGSNNLNSKPATTSISENIEAVRNKINPKSASDANQATSAPEVILSELTALRKKYDALVDYTVTLTTERDTIVNQLDVVQRELNKEKSKKKDNGSATKTDRTEKRVVDKGFSLFVVILTAIICFILGKFFSR